MISFSFRISNPFSKTYELVWSKFGKLADTIGWEWALSKTNVVVSFDFTIRTNCDHTGIHMSMGLLGFETEADIYAFAHKD